MTKMKHNPWFLVIALLLAACQPQPATGTPLPPADTPVVAAATTKSPGKSTSAPPVSSTASSPAQPAIHSSSRDPNAPNLIVVRDQPIVNNGVTIDSVTVAQAGWIVIYLAKKGQPGHQIGFVPVPVGKSQQFVVPLNQSPGTAVSQSKLEGERLFVILQAGPQAPGTPVQVQGRSVVEMFTVLAASKP